MAIHSALHDLRRSTPEERAAQIGKVLGLSDAQQTLLTTSGALGLRTADGMIENVIGTFELPMGVAANFQINERDVLVPMVVEEPSIVAAASYMAKLARESGGFQTSSSGALMRAQVQLVGIDDPYGARATLLRHKDELIELANRRDTLLTSLGGGCRDVDVHVFAHTPRGAMVVVHLIVDVRDAMGANTVNTMAEATAARIESLTGGSARLRILSNLADLRLARAHVRYRPSTLATDAYSGEEVVERVIDAYTFAAIDPYRAATHNKGIMNGIDPVIVATGNDWRAVEAGAHAYAARSGRYAPLTVWEKAANGDLVGTIEMPMPVGMVGGATKTHPLAQLALQILDVKSAQELGEIAVAVGLAQNMGALRALATEGIQRGHMALHARNIALAAGATGSDIDWLIGRMISSADFRLDFAREVLSGSRDR